MKSIWTMGEIIVELMRPDTEMPHNVPGVYLGPYPSGAPAIMISAAARLGAKTGIIGAVGNDKFGELIIDRLTKYGVNCKYIHKSELLSTGDAFVMYKNSGEREFIFHIKDSAAVSFPVPDVTKIPNVGFFHVMGCSLTADDRLREKIIKTAGRFSKMGVKISFDPNIRPELLRNRKVSELMEPIL